MTPGPPWLDVYKGMRIMTDPARLCERKCGHPRSHQPSSSRHCNFMRQRVEFTLRFQ
ncbi:uncharacterized protein BT62DRAFT_938739 [Guyanagaster necrorhizus]|uniref:Uncharacterized protein n=1 Tax=Guyanagaster necrorhizus TaxID=856835 RepID=A0A9P7VGQ0_9AGAR|nr:uncharacterized protein BT62DRAFT_938739 [Guyanagaster necrorhizus MCA 3950]KAG7439664.1 hypothetical protein BT62DRAFT_938739 [Guyanagaster necrorhizus MCA 3950]